MRMVEYIPKVLWSYQTTSQTRDPLFSHIRNRSCHPGQDGLSKFPHPVLQSRSQRHENQPPSRPSTWETGRSKDLSSCLSRENCPIFQQDSKASVFRPRRLGSAEGDSSYQWPDRGKIRSGLGRSLLSHQVPPQGCLSSRIDSRKNAPKIMECRASAQVSYVTNSCIQLPVFQVNKDYDSCSHCLSIITET